MIEDSIEGDCAMSDPFMEFVQEKKRPSKLSVDNLCSKLLGLCARSRWNLLNIGEHEVSDVFGETHEILCGSATFR